MSIFRDSLRINSFNAGYFRPITCTLNSDKYTISSVLHLSYSSRTSRGNKQHFVVIVRWQQTGLTLNTLLNHLVCLFHRSLLSHTITHGQKCRQHAHAESLRTAEYYFLIQCMRCTHTYRIPPADISVLSVYKTY